MERQVDDKDAQETLFPVDEDDAPRSKPARPHYNFKKYVQDQQLLIPLSVKELVKEDSLVSFIDLLINHLEEKGALDRIYRSYRPDGWGAPAYHPKMMLKIIFYAISHGILSSRQLARILEYNSELWYLSGMQKPDHRTISDFRNRHNDALQDIFLDILELCQEAGLVKVGRVAIDGTKNKANASMSSSYTRETLVHKIKELLEKAQLLDDDEDLLYGERRGDELPDDLSSEKAQQKVIEAAHRKLSEARGKKQEQSEERKKDLKRKREEDGGVQEQIYDGADTDESEETSSPEENEGSDPSHHDLDRLERHLDAYHQAGRKERDEREKQEDKQEQRELEEAEDGKKKKGRKLKDPRAIRFPELKGNTTDPDSRIMMDGHGHYVQGYNCQIMVDIHSQVIVTYGLTQEGNDVYQLIPMLEACRSNLGRMPGQCLADAGYWKNDHVPQFIDGCEMFVNTTKGWKLLQQLRENGAPRGRIPGGLSNRELMERKLLTKRGHGIYSDRYVVEALYGQLDTIGLTAFLRRGVPKVTTDWSLICSSNNLRKLYTSRRWHVSDSSLVIEGVGG